MGNWIIERNDSIKVALQNVTFLNEIRLPDGSSNAIPFDNNRIEITTEGIQVKIYFSDLKQIRKTDDGFMFINNDKRFFGRPLVNEQIVLSGFVGNDASRYYMNEILNATMYDDYNVKFSWEYKGQEIVCIAKAVDSSGNLMQEVKISSQFETAIDFENQLGLSIKNEMEKLAKEELRIILPIDELLEE